jgi:hypothetical protein
MRHLLGFVSAGSAVARRSGVALVLAALALPVAAPAQEPELTIELNNLAPLEAGGCRLTFVVTNGTDTSVSESRYQVAIFDAAGRVQGGLLGMNFGALDAGRLSIVQFDLGNRGCTDISQLHLNSVEACPDAATGADSDICGSTLATRTLIDGVRLTN